MRILMINTIQYNINGIANVILGICKALSQIYKCKIDITSYGLLDDIYKEEFNKNNISIIRVPSRICIFQYRKSIRNIIKKNKYDIVHIHGNSSTMILETTINHYGSTFIVHGHNTQCNHRYLNMILRPIFSKTYDLGVACSDDAGKFLFKNDYITISNGIDQKKFAFSSDDRYSLRKIYGIMDKKVVLHVGHFNRQKNQIFIVDIAKKMGKKYVFALVGNGETFKDIKDLSIKQNINNLLFLGEKNQIYKYYSMADLFIFPSLFESFGIALLEAQVNGLNCICSNFVPTDAEISNLVTFLPLEVNKWVETIKEKSCRCKNIVFNKKKDIYDEKIIASKFYNLYNKLRLNS